ncbi:MAG TPA: BTAD domain-containing putative transcriptional regulator [Gemmatimonadales bacterium]|nr:BTAD domain-containing putative transcriptional regulator [Gemmatimonadales bacterium]
MAPMLTLQLLGTPGVAGGDDVPGPPLTGQALALIAMLACAGERGVAREKLQAILWPEAETSAASHRLSQLVHWIRRTVASPALINGTKELRLRPSGLACDLWEFEDARRSGRLEQAATVYAPFMDGFYLTGGTGFERWAESRRSELAREHQEILEALAVQAEARGESLVAAEWWERLAQHDPLSSRVTMHLMNALAAAGERARALAHAQTYQRQVRAELEAEPSPAIVALAHLLTREPQGAKVRPDAGVAVLPLLALGDEPRVRSLADGLTEELMTALAEIAGVRVASRTAVTAVRQETPDVRELGARLGLSAVLEGSVRLAGRRVRVSVRLVDVTDGCQRWVERWDVAEEDACSGEEALAREVAGRFRRRTEGA